MKRDQGESHPFDDIDNDLTMDFEYWEISDNGDISLFGRDDIRISSKDLLSMNWLSHEIKKERRPNSRSAESEFYLVYIEALRRAGYRTITIDVRDENAPIVGKK